MSSEKFDAKVDQFKGAAKEFAGKLTGDKETETEGTVEKVVGKVKEVAADAKDAVDGAISGLKNSLDKDK